MHWQIFSSGNLLRLPSCAFRNISNVVYIGTIAAGGGEFCRRCLVGWLVGWLGRCGAFQRWMPHVHTATEGTHPLPPRTWNRLHAAPILPPPPSPCPPPRPPPRAPPPPGTSHPPPPSSLSESRFFYLDEGWGCTLRSTRLMATSVTADNDSQWR